jgi:excinuclease ABC subunit B
VAKNMLDFTMRSNFKPKGSQPEAIKKLVKGLRDDKRSQTLLGVTGSGKTFTMANVIKETQRSAFIIAHNKTLAMQLYNEMTELFPDTFVGFFASSYDYFCPEGTANKFDLSGKNCSINSKLRSLRNLTLKNLLDKKPVIIISTVSCLYEISSPNLLRKSIVEIGGGDKINMDEFSRKLVQLGYERVDEAFDQGTFRIRGDIIDIIPPYLEDVAHRISVFGNEIENLYEVNSITGEKIKDLKKIKIYPAKNNLIEQPIKEETLKKIEMESLKFIDELATSGQKKKANYLKDSLIADLGNLRAIGYCSNIGNYKKFLTEKKSNGKSFTIFDYLADDTILFVDESHITIPQIHSMYKGDLNRKEKLIDYGLAFPSYKETLPLTFDEWNEDRGQTIFVSATPRDFEIAVSGGKVVEQIIRPTGLIDPECVVKAKSGQIQDIVKEVRIARNKGLRTLVTTTTKKYAEELADFLKQQGLKAVYLHSDVETFERVRIISCLKRGIYDVIVGINLLREGLDIPECGLIGILDADQSGFLRDRISLIQTIGRASRNTKSKVILYADQMTPAIKEAVEETARRREIQMEYNQKHGIRPKTIVSGSVKKDGEKVVVKDEECEVGKQISTVELDKRIFEMRAKIKESMRMFEFDEAELLKTRLKRLENLRLSL